MANRSEHIEQRETVQWFRQTHRGVLIHSIPNGGKRDQREALRLKVEGVVAGIPDLHVPAWNLWVEMKTLDGSLSPAQKEIITYLESVGDTVITAHGKDDAIEQITAFCKTRNANPRTGTIAAS